MECKLLLFFTLVICSNLVVSYPHEEHKHRAYQPADWSTAQSLPRHAKNVNYQPPNVPRGYQEIAFEQWPRQQNMAKPQIVNSNVPQTYYQNTLLQIPHGQRLQHNNNFARPQNEYSAPLNYEEVTLTPDVQPEARRIDYQQQMSSLQSKYNAPSEGWWSGQRSPQQYQNEIFEGPYTANNFVNSYPEPFVDQSQKSYGQHFQTLPQTTSNHVSGIENYRRGWPIPNQYNHMSVPWPANSYQNTPTRDPQYIEPIIPLYNKPAYPAYAPVVEDPALDALFQNDHIKTVPSQRPVTVNRKRYIIVHANGTYENVDNVDDILANDVPNHILAILEVEDKIKETANENSFVLLYDTGISKIPQDTYWNTDYQDDPGTQRNYNYPNALRTELHKPLPNLQITNEDTEMSYFKPEYIMPIQSITENSTDTTTNTPFSNTDIYGNVDVTKNYYIDHYTQHKTDKNMAQIVNDGEFSSDDNSFTSTFAPSEEGLNYEQPTYIGIKTTSMEILPSSTQDTRFQTDRQPTTIVYENDYVDNITDDQGWIPPSKNTYSTTKDLENVTGNNVQETTTYPVDDNIDITAPTESLLDDTPTEFHDLREDLKVDISNLKTIVDKPVVWFRPDEKFWDKVTKGDNAFDAVQFYDVKCQPKLIERETTIHHYPNGTEVVDYIETLWNHPKDLSPTELRSNRVVRHPGE